MGGLACHLGEFRNATISLVNSPSPNVKHSEVCKRDFRDLFFFYSKNKNDKKNESQFYPKLLLLVSGFRMLHCIALIRRKTVFHILKKQNQQDILKSE